MIDDVADPFRTAQKNLRKTGIDIIDMAPWGTHLCLFYETRQDLRDALLPYFKSGLESNEHCIWITTDLLNSNEAKIALEREVPAFNNFLKKERIEIIPYDKWLLENEVFNSQKILSNLIQRHDYALSRGLEGLRLAGDTFWLEKKDWQGFNVYEGEVNNHIRNRKMMALCTYSLKKCSAAEVIDVIGTHQIALIKRTCRMEMLEASEIKKTKAEIQAEIMERERAEDALMATEQRYRSLVEMAPEAIFVERDNRIVYWNRATLKLLAASNEKQIEGRSPLEFFHPTYHKIIAERIAKLKEGKKIPSTEGKIVRFDGTTMVVEIVASSFTEKGQSVVQIMMRDITERKLLDEKIKESEWRFRTIANSTYDWEYWQGSRGNIFYMSPSCQKITGYSSEELKNNPTLIESIVAPEHLSIFHEHLSLSKSANTRDCNMDFKIRTKDGEEKWISHRCHAVFSDDGMFIGRRITNRDTTKQRAAEEALRLANEHLEIAQQAANAGTWDWDLRTNRLVWSGKMYELFGLNQKSVIASFEAWENALHRVDKSGAPHELIDAIKKHEKLTGEYQVIWPDGQTRWINAIGQAQYDDEGNPVRASGICLDITDLKRAEAELKKYSEKLEELVRERTHEIGKAKSKLIASERLSSMGRLGAAVAHQLASPLCAIGLLVEMLKNGTFDESKRNDFLKQIDQMVVAMQHSIQCMRELTGAVMRDNKTCVAININSVLTVILDLAQIECKTKGISIVKDFDENTPEIVGICGELDQVFINIVNNAVDAMPDGGKLSVSTHKGDVSVRITIEDTGIGIPPEHIARLFEPFFSVSDNCQSLGLGLSIAEQIVKKYDGDITVQSEVGSGTSFSIIFPTAQIRRNNS